MREPSKELLRNMYLTMWLIRRFEEKAGELFTTGVLKKGGVHSSVGQEAVAVGVCSALRKDDWITSTHRGHGHHIAKGANLRRLISELLGREDGYCKGRGGSMHVAAFEVGSLGAYAVVGEGVPIGTGAALSMYLQGIDRVVASFFGDGGLGQGAVHEALNLASIWTLPIVFVCENNRIAVSTRTEETVAASRHLETLAKAHAMEGHSIDGQDVLLIYRTARTAIERARRGEGPTLIDCRTYRFEGHYYGEPQVYRTREEIEEMRRTQDPIAKFESYLIGQSILSKRQLKELQELASEQVEDAAQYAQKSSEPDPETYRRFVHA